jgi:hypothetical protein
MVSMVLRGIALALLAMTLVAWAAGAGSEERNAAPEPAVYVIFT